jgi:predicted AAA+ superfamily ATPase
MPPIPRPELKSRVEEALRRSPLVMILGPRQCGKTTLARGIAAERKAAYFDLENPRDEARLAEPLLALERLRGLVVVDEVQRRPDLFPLLRVLADRRPLPARFLLLGSASPWLVRGVSESLAGRVAFVDMGGFSLDEVGVRQWRRLWFRGAFPEAFRARSAKASTAWRESFVRTFLERDLPQLGVQVPAAVLRRFWTMLAHYHRLPTFSNQGGAGAPRRHRTGDRGAPQARRLLGGFRPRPIPCTSASSASAWPSCRASVERSPGRSAGGARAGNPSPGKAGGFTT